MGEEKKSMGEKPGLLLSLLIILKVFGSTEASCSLGQVTGSLTANCGNQDLTSVPQNLPTGTTNLDLRYNQITTISHSDFSCNFGGQKLKDISPEDLICEVPTIARFERVYKFTEVEGGNLHLVCKASGIPTPDITVILPSGLSANVESGGRVTVGVNGAITITNVTAEDAGLYFCTAVSPVGSTFAVLVVNVQLKATTTGIVAPVTSSLTSAFKPESSSSYHQSVPAFSISVPVFIATACGSVLGIVLIFGAIIFAVWHMRKKQKPSSDQPPPVVFSNTSANVPISEHDQTGQGGAQSRSESFETTRTSEYEDVVLPARNVNTSLTAAGLIQQPHEYQSLVPNRNRAPRHELPPLQQQHDYQSLGPNRNRAPSDELPPLPPPSNRNDGGPTGAQDIPHYQPLHY
ncbi:hypothetical protein Bbelb_137600 [Branchiostoma belcheri]|nr:hypothetical protein Bbelb_137600 [Branchiostoma belcheri]